MNGRISALAWLSVLAVLLAGIPAAAGQSAVSFKVSRGAAPGYVKDRLCAGCHPEIYRSYQKVGMSRSFARPANSDPIEDFDPDPYYHAPSKRYYQMGRDPEGMTFKRYQLDGDGKPINVWERRVDWVLGSGSTSRTYLYQTPSGELFQLPIAWYSQSRRWAMAPGYDAPDHEGVQRAVRRECMFCHNAYPEVAEGSDVHGKPATFPGALPEGTGCQRCHGPGARHVESAISGVPSQAAIVNPRRLDRALRNDVCDQCHLQPSIQLFGLRRFDRPDYSYRPGTPLGDYSVQFDVDEPYQRRDERFEINHHPYRLRQSRCHEESGESLECLTCHDPHRKPDPEQRAEHFRNACLTCHQLDQCSRPESPDDRTGDDCVSCHMPRRRTQDVVHVVMTDHRIQRPPTAGQDLLAPLQEREPSLTGAEVLSPDLGGESRIYLLTGLVRTSARRDYVDELSRLLESRRPREAGPSLDLAKAQLYLRRFEAADRTLTRLVEESPLNLDALELLANSKSGQGKFADAANLMEPVLRNAPTRAESHFNMGLFLGALDRPGEARKELYRAIALRPTIPAAWFYLGELTAGSGNPKPAILHYQRCLEIDPAFSRAYLSLGKLLLELDDRPQALRYLRHGASVARQPEPIRELLKELLE